MSGRIKIKPKNKDKKPKTDVFKVIEDRFKNMNELRDLIDMDPKKGLVRIRDGAGFREVERGGCLHRNYLNLLEEAVGGWGRPGGMRVSFFPSFPWYYTILTVTR